MRLSDVQGPTLVMSMLEEDKRMDIRWSEQFERGQVRALYFTVLATLVAKYDISADPQKEQRSRSAFLQASPAGHHGQLNTSTSDVFDNTVTTAEVHPKGESNSTVLQNALDIAGKENAKLRQVIQNLRTEMVLLKERLGIDDSGDITDAVGVEFDHPEAPTPAERAWQRAVSLHHLPRTVSEESLTEETYTWRGTLETRERAIRKRERLLSEKEEDVVDVQRKAADLEQQSKELAIKDREYKLRFRGLEEREKREGDLPRRLQEIDEREQALEERERLMQEQLEEVEELKRQLQSGGGHTDPAAGIASGGGADAKPPQTLVVTVPNLYDMAGTYTLHAEQRRGRPQWECEDRLMYHEAGKWVIGFDYEADDGVAWVSSTEKHNNRLPHMLKSWSFVPGEGEPFEVDPEITVTPQ
eukprot:TRINITY_DN4202_c0_g1_i1.p1 TRINITY_DN4202_c0_g1~~TRINITY_DN4202_c0_g1_i1.p1  ORF type:complete len:415 (+),score=133.07 TRINITY_DN4202_c0_g1_i1:273-1517(+)